MLVGLGKKILLHFTHPCEVWGGGYEAKDDGKGLLIIFMIMMNNILQAFMEKRSDYPVWLPMSKIG